MPRITITTDFDLSDSFVSTPGMCARIADTGSAALIKISLAKEDACTFLDLHNGASVMLVANSDRISADPQDLGDSACFGSAS